MSLTEHLALIFSSACIELVPTLAGEVTPDEFTYDEDKTKIERFEVKRDSHSVSVYFGEKSIRMASNQDGTLFTSWMNSDLRESALPVQHASIGAMMGHVLAKISAAKKCAVLHFKSELTE